MPSPKHSKHNFYARILRSRVGELGEDQLQLWLCSGAGAWEMFGGILKGGAVVVGFGLLGFVVGASNHGGGCIGLNGALAHTGVYG